MKTGKLLSPETRRAELERFRGFLSWCVAQRWLKENHAKAKDSRCGRSRSRQKLGMNPHEEELVFDAMESWSILRSHRATQRPRDECVLSGDASLGTENL